MARFDRARWMGTPNFTRGGMVAKPRGLVFHVTQGAMPGCLSWLQNPRAQASAHFINPRNGGLLQLVDTADKAWAQAAGNPYWISVEHEGMSGQGLTESQIVNDVALVRWMERTHGMPLRHSTDASSPGITTHGAGGRSWGGHPACPGDAIKNLIAPILDRARGGTGEANFAPPDHAATALDPNGPNSVEALVTALPILRRGSTGQHVRIAQGLLTANGRSVSVDGDFGPGTESALREWQGAADLDADGVCGPRTWRRLLCV